MIRETAFPKPKAPKPAVGSERERLNAKRLLKKAQRKKYYPGEL